RAARAIPQRAADAGPDAAGDERGRTRSAASMNRPDDLDALVNELNAEVAPARAAAGDDGQTTRLRGWLEQVVERNASDLLLVAGAAPAIRVDGAIAPLHEGPLG